LIAAAPGSSRYDYRIFVGAFPVSKLTDEIQSLRQRYDPKTARITAPHVTLAGTYRRRGPATLESEGSAIAHLRAIQGEIAPFELILGGIYTFPPASRPVIYLGVERTPTLLAARRCLIEALGRDGHRDFKPHLTIAMRFSGQAARRALAELQAGPWQNGRWQVPIRELCLMQRGPADPVWRCIARFPLG
jgi:2'-5' RNA ligase